MSELIGGKEALIALANGCELEAKDAHDWKKVTWDMPLSMFDNGCIVFRIKPRTVKLEIEVPAPFEPRYGEKYWFVCLNVKDGYASTENENLTFDRYRINFGVYQTEAEIKIVVEQLRKLGVLK